MLDNLGVTFAGFSPLGPIRATEVARLAADLGYRSYWTAEASGPESFAVLAACGAAAPELDLGTGIVPIQIRSPLLAAMGAATLQALHPERRILLGVGISTPPITERWHGVPYGERPVARMAEYLRIVRALLDGERVSCEGPFWHLRGAQLGMRLGQQKPQLVVAALNPKMLRVAGRLADGVLLNYLPANHVPNLVATVREAEAAAGRTPGSCRIWAYVHAGVADPEAAVDRARRDIFGYASAQGYGNMMIAAGYGDEINELRAAMASGDRDAAVAAVSQRMIDAIDFVGTPEGVRSYFDAYAEAGVDEPVLMPLPWGEDRMGVISDTLAALAG
ncbi:MAG: LLM class flavin-dependent oxidoreductase [Acidimicrobiia bacterium]|nr:LLM class flavin-dependent oxidoreductase [Acidimicrobiia bacterium]